MRTRFKYVAPQESAVERNEQTMMIVFSYYNFPCLLDIFLNSLLKLQGCRPQLEARANQGSLESAVIQIISDVYVTHIYMYICDLCVYVICVYVSVYEYVHVFICICTWSYMYMICVLCTWILQTEQNLRKRISSQISSVGAAESCSSLFSCILSISVQGSLTF